MQWMWSRLSKLCPLLCALYLWSLPYTISSGLESSAAAAPSINVEILVGDKVVSLTATLDQDAHHAAKAFCYHHNLTSSREDQGRGGCTQAVEAELLHAYHQMEEESCLLPDVTPFSRIRSQSLPFLFRYRPEIDDAELVLSRLKRRYPGFESTASSLPTHGLYIPNMDELEDVSRSFPKPILSLNLDLEWSPQQKRPFALYPGQELKDAVIGFCARNQCPDRLNQIDQIMAALKQVHQTVSPSPSSSVTIPIHSTPLNERVVVSMTTLPSRLPYIAERIQEIREKQTHPPDHIYISVPEYSLRERELYHPIPSELLDDPTVTVLHSALDWGPATKIIPVLDVEREATTMVITMDDDLRYPSHTIGELVRNSRRLPNAALGFLGYRLPPSGPMSHATFRYKEGCNETSDVMVDILGGVGAVLYRVGFFDRPRLQDYLYYPSASFYVDDEWIASALDESGIPRIVLSRIDAPMTACALMEDHNLLHYSKSQTALNGPAQATYNMRYQTMVLKYLREKEHLFPPWSDQGQSSESFVEQVFVPEYEPLLRLRAHSFRYMLEWLEGLGRPVTIVETGTISDPGGARWGTSGQSTLLFDRLISFLGGKPSRSDRDSVLYSLDLDDHACKVARQLTSNRTIVIEGDSIRSLSLLSLEGSVGTLDIDLLYLDSFDVDDFQNDAATAEHHLKELAAILSRTRTFRDQGHGTLIAVDDNLQTKNDSKGTAMLGKGRLVQEFLEKGGRCNEVFRGWQVGWICGGCRQL